MSSGSLIANKALLTSLLGECLVEWAQVERNLWYLYRTASPDESKDESIAILSSIVSFDARLGITQKLAEIRFNKLATHSDEDKMLIQDLCLLLQKVRRKYRHRNELAHSTLVFDCVKMDMFLEPYMIEGVKGKNRLSAADLTARLAEFKQISEATGWLWLEFYRCIVGKRTRGDTDKVPDLVIELRAAETAKRMQDQENSRLLRVAKDLLAAGKLQSDGRKYHLI